MALVLRKFTSTSYIISDFCPYSQKVIEVMILAQINPAKFKIFYQVFLDAK